MAPYDRSYTTSSQSAIASIIIIIIMSFIAQNMKKTIATL